MKTVKAFSLIEALVATVIGAISILAITYSYIFFNNSYKKITDKAKMSASGRSSLQMVAKDLRNAGYKNMNYEATSGQTWDRWIEKIDAFDGTTFGWSPASVNIECDLFNGCKCFSEISNVLTI